MTKYYLHKPIYAMLLVSLFFTSCNGQTKTQPQADSVSKLNTNPTGQPKLIKSFSKNQQYEEAENVRCGLQDKAGNLWFGSTGDGVYRYDGKTFMNYTTKDGLNSNTVMCMIEDNVGNIWFGTSVGLCCYEPQTGIISTVEMNANKNTLPYSLSNNTQPVKNQVLCSLKDKNGTLWFCTNEGVFLYDGKIFTCLLDNSSIINKNGLKLKRVESILEDKSGNIWFASWDNEGVCRLDGKSLLSIAPPGNGRNRNFLEDKKGTIWLCYLWQPSYFDGKTFKKFDETKDISFPLLADKSGNIWFSGSDNGNGHEGRPEVLWSYDGKSLKSYSAKDGAGNYGVYFMMQDSSGNIWIGTRNTGLYRYDGKVFTKFSE